MARLRRVTLRSRPERMELNILRGILSATEKAAGGQALGARGSEPELQREHDTHPGQKPAQD